jgi:hypothetical protein
MAADGDSDKATGEKSRLKMRFKFSDVRAPANKENERFIGYSNRQPRSICSHGETNFILVW